VLDYAHAHPEAGVDGPRLCDGLGRPQTSFRTRPTVGAPAASLMLFRWTGLFRRAYQRYRGRDDDL